MARRLLDYDNLSELELFRIIESDPGMSARVLGLSNSLVYRVSGPPSTTLREALLRIGYDLAHSIALSFALLGQITSQRCSNFDTRMEWRHAMAVAFCARQMNACIGYSKLEPAKAFISGLVHNVGILSLAALSPLLFETLMEAAQRNEALPEDERRPFSEVEKEILGLAHTELGEEVAKFWGLPEEAVCAIRWHRAPFSAPEPFRDLAIAVNALGELASIAGAPPLISVQPKSGPAETLAGDALEQLGLNRDLVPQMVASMKEKVGWVDELLRIGKT